MNAPYELVNSMARQCFQMPPKRMPHNNTAQIEFMDFDLVVELDYMGHVEAIQNAKSGKECICAWSDWAIGQITHLANAEVRREHRLSLEPS